MKTLSEIFKTVYTSINDTFPNSIVFDAKVHTIDDKNKRTFTVKLPNDCVYLKCISLSQIENVKENDFVRINGKPRINRSGIVCIKIDEFCIIDEESKTTVSLNKLKNLFVKINGKDSSIALNILKKKIPSVVENIGIIYIDKMCFDNKLNTETIAPLLKQTLIDSLVDFKGTVYFLNIDCVNIEASLHDALELYRRYYNINIVSIVTNNLTIDEIVELNSTSILKYLLLNKHSYPYVTLYSNTLRDLQPLTKLVNVCFDSIQENALFLNNANKLFINNVHNDRTTTLKAINNQILLLENYIMKTEIFMIDTFEQFIKSNPIHDAKKLLLDNLSCIENTVHLYTTNLLTHILDQSQHVLKLQSDVEQPLQSIVEYNNILANTPNNSTTTVFVADSLNVPSTIEPFIDRDINTKQPNI